MRLFLLMLLLLLRLNRGAGLLFKQPSFFSKLVVEALLVRSCTILGKHRKRATSE